MSLNTTIKIILLALGIVASSIISVVSFINEEYFAMLISIIAIVVFTTSIVYFIHSVNRKIGYFLESLENEDFSIRFPMAKVNKSEKYLNRILNNLKGLLQKTRTEIEQKEKFYELITNNISSGIITIDEKGFVTQTNHIALKFLGLDVFTHVSQLERVSPEMKRVFTEIKSGESRQIPHYNERGKLQLLIHASTVILDNSRVTLLVLNDIEKEMDEKEIDSWIKLIRILSHEIMNSIAPVMSISETLLSMYDREILESESVKQNTIHGLQAINETSRGLVAFVDSYRKFTRIPTPQKELIDLKTFFEKIDILCRTEPNYNETELIIEVEPVGLKVYADLNLLYQVVLNMMKNAYQSLLNKPCAEISLSASIDEQDAVVIKVKDNGVGIPQDILNEIFVPFFTTKKEGSGIGLSIARQIMRAHNGSIKVNSVENKGTTFILCFDKMSFS